jgi:hypothetical protein
MIIIKMIYAIDKNGNIISSLEIANKIIKNKKFTCIDCCNNIIFVSESKRSIAHFRHKSIQNKCYYKNKKYIENKMSDFHVNWQKIFPKTCIERRLKLNNKLHIADIYIESINNINIKINNIDIFNKQSNNLIIEIQHSPISIQDLVNRETFYNNFGNFIWIFDCNNTISIDKIITFKNTIYKLKLDGDHSFLSLFNTKLNPCVFLDLNDKFLYYIYKKIDRNDTNVKTIRIQKNLFLNQLSSILHYNLTDQTNNDKNINYITYNYKSISNINIIKYIFYVLEHYEFSFDKYYYQLIEGLSNISNKSSIILEALINYIKKNKPSLNTKIYFGKYKGTTIEDLNDNYVDFLINKYKLKCNVYRYCECKECNLFLELRYINEYNSINITKLYYNLDSDSDIQDIYTEYDLLKIIFGMTYKYNIQSIILLPDIYSKYVIHTKKITFINIFKTASLYSNGQSNKEKQILMKKCIGCVYKIIVKQHFKLWKCNFKRIKIYTIILKKIRFDKWKYNTNRIKIYTLLLKNLRFDKWKYKVNIIKIYEMVLKERYLKKWKYNYSIFKLESNVKIYNKTLALIYLDRWKYSCENFGKIKLFVKIYTIKTIQPYFKKIKNIWNRPRLINYRLNRLVYIYNNYEKYIKINNFKKWIVITNKINPLSGHIKYNDILRYLKNILITKNIYNLNKFNRFIINKTHINITKYLHKNYPENTINSFIEDYQCFI